MLITIGGLPATGKTTIARALGSRLGALHVRIDTIEQAIVRSGLASQPLGPVGYAVGYALVEDALRQGFTVIAESVNPLEVTRDAWLAVAERTGARCTEVEVVCSDPIEHERRATSRVVDIPDLVVPSWNAIRGRMYEPWSRAHVVVDTAGCPLDQCVAQVLSSITL